MKREAREDSEKRERKEEERGRREEAPGKERNRRQNAYSSLPFQLKFDEHATLLFQWAQSRLTKSDSFTKRLNTAHLISFEHGGHQYIYPMNHVQYRDAIVKLLDDI